MTSLECPVVPAGTAFSLTPATTASVDSSGAISFTPEVHRFCGHCRELCLLCACEGDSSAGRDCIFCNLPPPRADSDAKSCPDTGAVSTAHMQQVLVRWASLVEACKPLSFDPHMFLQGEGERLVDILSNQGARLLSMVENFIAQLSSSEQLPTLINALGFFPKQDKYPVLRGNPEQWTADLTHEARAAAEAYICGDWACITRLGLLLLNCAFIESDPQEFSPEDAGLQHLYQGLKLLMKLYSDAFSDTGVRYALEMERTASRAEKQFRERRASITGKEEAPLPSARPTPTNNAGYSDGQDRSPVMCKPCK